MFLFLSKFLPQFVYPLGLVTLLLLLALLAWKSPQASRWLLIAALAVIFIAGNKWVSSALIRSLEWKHLPSKTLPAVDAIVLLGGGTLPAEYPRPTVEISGAGDRVVYAAWLYKQQKAPIILLTGGSLPWSTSPSSPAAQMKEILLLMGIPEEALWIEDQSVNTYENALFSKTLLEEAGIHRILLVTSALHMPRSVMLFEKQGFDVIPAPTDFTVTSSPAAEAEDWWVDFLTDIFPSVNDLDNTTQALREYLGILVYRLRGWV